MSAYDHLSYLYAVVVLVTFAFLPPAAICVFSYYNIIKKVRVWSVRLKGITSVIFSDVFHSELSGGGQGS